MIVLYSTHCPKCRILEKKLKEKNIIYDIEDNPENILALGFDEVPVLKVNEEFLRFKEANEWVNNYILD